MDDQELDEGFKERFEALLARFPSMKMAADVAGYSAEQLAKWRDGKARAPLRPIANLCQASATSLDWLVFNREMPSSAIVTATDGELPDGVWIPLLEVIASAGPGYENARPYELRRLPFPRTWLQRLGVPEKYARFLGIDGDSMEPTIMDGWIVLVDTRPKHARANGIYVLVDGPNVRVKRIALGWQNSIVLISDNERYQSEQLSPPDAEALQVAGRIVWAGGEI